MKERRGQKKKMRKLRGLCAACGGRLTGLCDMSCENVRKSFVFVAGRRISVAKCRVLSHLRVPCGKWQVREGRPPQAGRAIRLRKSGSGVSGSGYCIRQVFGWQDVRLNNTSSRSACARGQMVQTTVSRPVMQGGLEAVPIHASRFASRFIVAMNASATGNLA